MFGNRSVISILPSQYILVVTLDGSVPIKYGLLLNTDDNYKMLKKQLAKLCCLTPAQLLMAELIGASIKVRIIRYRMI